MSETSSLARHIGAFAKAHGGAVDATIQHIGREWYRIVLVGADGAWGDAVARSRAAAEDAVRAAGAAEAEDAAASLRTGPYEWRRMAGLQL